MKRIQLVASLLLALALPSAASAGTGFNLAWDDCLHGTGVTTKAFACDTDAGSHSIVVSLIPPVSTALWTGFEVEMSVNSTSAALPDWWRLRNQSGQLGQCRAGAIGANADGSAMTGCTDPYLGMGVGGVATYQVAPNGQAYMARVLLAFGIPAASVHPLEAGEEYFVARMVISNSKTTGATGCAGCPSGACIVGSSVKVVQPDGAPGGNYTVGFHDESPGVSWQNAQVTISDCGIGCFEPGKPSLVNCAICPVVPSSWGRVKAIYR